MEFTTADAARYLGVNRRWAAKLCREKKLKAREVDGRWRIAREDLVAFAARSRKPGWYGKEKASHNS